MSRDSRTNATKDAAGMTSDQLRESIEVLKPQWIEVRVEVFRQALAERGAADDLGEVNVAELAQGMLDAPECAPAVADLAAGFLDQRREFARLLVQVTIANRTGDPYCDVRAAFEALGLEHSGPSSELAEVAE